MKNLAPNGKQSNLTPKQYDDGGLIIDDNIKLFGLNNYTKSKKSGKFYKLIAERKINDKETENWWIYFTIKDGKKTLGVLRYRFENEEKDIYNEKIISLSDLPKSLLDIYNKFELGGSILLAPNGKKSNLTPEQYKLVRSTAFKKWFGDWENSPKTASKIVDENGEPLVVYHGTYSKFNVFDREELGMSQGRSPANMFGFYFSNNKNVSQSFGKYVLSCFLNIRKPKFKDIEGKDYSGAKNIVNDFISKIKSNDGAILLNYKDSGGNKPILANQYIVPNSNQIKLADGTNTTFDGSNPDIRYAKGGIINNEFIYTIGGL
jgi:hypothetical protein